ncbi:MAG: multiheme c-type cytochrome, partial [Blastocatellia bacterium]
MKHRAKKRALNVAVLFLYLLIVGISYDSTSVSSGQKSFAQRWHPTKVPAGVNFAGEQACAECHKNKVVSQLQSSMGMAMEEVSDSKVLTTHPMLTFRKGNYSYEITRKGNQSFYSVSDGRETISLPILFAMGQGKAGQTYILQHEGAYYESLVSFYAEIKGLDFTIGAPRTTPESLRGAIGRRLSLSETRNCFACHSTGAVKGNQLHLDNFAHGVRCEACHGPGGEHIAAGRAGEPSAKLIFNPARLSGDELTQDFCASCHRGNEEFSLLKSLEINNVRFQPYRIFHSKCYSDDRRISCTACHDPHEPLKVDAAYYDAKCLKCHQSSGKVASGKVASGKVASGKASGGNAAQAAVSDKPSEKGCRVGTKDCASCHMPKVEPPG